MEKELQITAQIVFDSGLVIEDGELCFGPCESPLELEGKLALLVGAIADNGDKERTKEDLAWLLQATTDWRAKAKCGASVACAMHEDGTPLNELEEYLARLTLELSRLPELCHEHVTEVTLWYSGIHELKEVTFSNDEKGDTTGNWLYRAIRKGIRIES